MINKENLVVVFKRYTEELPDKTQMNDLLFYLEKGFYTQVIYKFPKDYLPITLKYFELVEKYEICAKIKQEIKEHNKINNDNVKIDIDG